MQSEIVVGDGRNCTIDGRKPFDLFLVDPPYNQGVKYRGFDDSKEYLEFLNFLCELYASGVRNLRDGGTVIVIISDEWAAESVVALKEMNLTMVNWIKWHETFGENQKAKFSRCSRHVLYFVKGDMSRRTWNDMSIRVKSKRQEMGDSRANPIGKVPDDVWTFSRVCGTFKERCHEVPNQIPEQLLTRIILGMTCPRDRVLEYCAGSGSLGRVCVREGREYEGWEIDPTTAEVARRRIQEVISDEEHWE